MVEILCLILGIAIGWKVREAVATMIMRKFLQSVSIEEESPDSKYKPIKIERIGEILYVYDLEDNFLTQGKTKTELETNLASKYPGFTFACSSENLRQLGW